ncbi:MAG: hypothetical protein VYE22_39220 [Myxococcota bacterium]|nr:hypothetical protein [Myxococcota bacterium]
MRAALLLTLLLAGCATEETLTVELRPPRAADGGPALPIEAERVEVRLVRKELGECPTAAEAAASAPSGTLAHVQSFPIAEGMGRAIGETPSGRWALSALVRDASCGVLLYGCTLTRLEDAGGAIVVELEPVSIPETCGCRECDGAGACGPEERVCE